MNHRTRSLAAIAALTMAMGGCMYPVVTGGAVEFDVFVVRDAGLPSGTVGSGSLGTHCELERVPRAIVVVQYTGSPRDWPAVGVAVVGGQTSVVEFPPRLHLAVQEHAKPFGVVYPSSREGLGGWVFAAGCWPARLDEYHIDQKDYPSQIWTKWQDRLAVPASKYGKARVVLYPQSRPWDGDIAYAAGCSDGPEKVNRETLRAMGEAPCALVGAIEGAGSLSAEDKRVVYGQLQALYEHTKSYWFADETRRTACDMNIALLRRQLASVSK